MHKSELFIGNVYKEGFSTVGVLIHEAFSDGLYAHLCTLVGWLWTVNLGRDAQDLGFKLLLSQISQNTYSSAWNLVVSYCASRSVFLSFFSPQDFSWKLERECFQACSLKGKEWRSWWEQSQILLAGQTTCLHSLLREGICQILPPSYCLPREMHS